MRQGGFKPKSHKSGAYWIRANAQTGGGKKKKASINQKNEDEDKLELPKFLDPDGDGKVSSWEWAQSIIVIVSEL